MYTSTGTLRKPDYVKEYAPLVKRIAHHMMSKLPASVQIDDIIQAGLIGLMDAVNRYEQEQGVQFETYATQRIRGAMLDELRRNDWLPRGVRRSQRRIETALHSLEQKLGRVPKEREVAAEMGVPLTVLMLVILRYAGPVRPLATMLLAALGMSGLSAAGLAFFHPVHTAWLGLVWHGAALAIVLASGALGSALLRMLYAPRRA